LLNKQLSDCLWPTFDQSLTEKKEITIVVQVNGKLRANVSVAPGAQQEQVEGLAKQAVEKWLEDKSIVKIIFVPGRLVNFVVR
jgi:leucyl-tRNA synthetase